MKPNNQIRVEYFVGIMVFISWCLMVLSFPPALLPETGFPEPLSAPIRHVWELTVSTPYEGRNIVVHGHWDTRMECNEWQHTFLRNGFSTSACYYIPWTERAL